MYLGWSSAITYICAVWFRRMAWMDVESFWQVYGGRWAIWLLMSAVKISGGQNGLRCDRLSGLGGIQVLFILYILYIVSYILCTNRCLGFIVYFYNIQFKSQADTCTPPNPLPMEIYKQCWAKNGSKESLGLFLP